MGANRLEFTLSSHSPHCNTDPALVSAQCVWPAPALPWSLARVRPLRDAAQYLVPMRIAAIKGGNLCVERELGVPLQTVACRNARQTMC
jgi:hypothetical protein